MGIYTVLENPEIDETIESHLKLIIEELSKITQVREIILGGGFGRGEGSVILRNGKIRPVNDYDIFVIADDEKCADFVKLEKKLADKIDIRLVDIIPIRYSSLSVLPATQFYYDLKYGGKHLWGEKLLDSMPAFKKGRLEKNAPKTLLLNRMICAIEAYSEDFRNRKMNEEESFFLINQTGKVVSSCVEALLMKKHIYHHSLRQRKKIFESEFMKEKELISLNDTATRFKLDPSSPPPSDPLNYWEKTVCELINAITGFISPGFFNPVKRIFKKLTNDKTKKSATNIPVERVEILLLLCKSAQPPMRYKLLSLARGEFEEITGEDAKSFNWETLREKTARHWHQIHK